MTTGKFSRRSALGAGFSSLLLPHVAWPQESERQVEGGIGGTGIVGVVTELGDLVVSGNRVQTDSSTEFSDAFGRLAASDIRLGDSLTVEADGPADALRARRVHVTTPLVGRVYTASTPDRRMTVNGVDVLLPPGLPLPEVGTRVAVSGLWRGASVVASRISPARRELDVVSGDVARAGSRVTIGTVTARGRGVAGLVSGGFARAVGLFAPDQGVIRASELATARFIGAAGPLAWLSIEGYLTPAPRAPGYRIAGLGHSFERTLDLRLYADARVLFNGRYTGRFAAQSAVILPEAEAQRRQLLRQIANG
ncbi:DUF5666 domain-containing protein [Roseobacter sinensis]|uniref:DUF5666 domain-containing protein n=1 Tax=Roseobacter sinensis TaxID=2931391 RepID=A0ABT3BKB5_9RHOB|nr:DUF5666 domain-containing protein [Roseobacter sp. WL0113]MCV3274023.1 DUF5666 domain-containing protein [Roseobacter sp. WL0113]